MSTEEIVGACVKVTTEQVEGQYKVEQTEVSTLQLEAPPEDDDNGMYQSIDWSFGPIKMHGYLDTNTFELSISPMINGICTGILTGNLKDGLGLKIQLHTVMGEQRWYLKNGSEFWTHYNLKILFDGSFEGDKKIMTL